MDINYFVGVDLAQKHDYTAVAIVAHTQEYRDAVRRYEDFSEKVARASRMRRHYDRTDMRFLEDDLDELGRRLPHPSYDCVQAYRLERGTPWSEIKRHIRTIMTSPVLCNKSQLVVDAPGVGDPIVDDLRRTDSSEEEPLNVRAVTIATPAMAAEHRVEDRVDDWIVPKPTLVSFPQVLFGSCRLRIAEGIAFKDVLLEEITSYEYATTPAGNIVTGSWREGQHDDLVLALLCLALWDASRSGGLSPNPALSGTLGTAIRPEDLESLPEWFLEAPEDDAPSIEQDEPGESIWGSVVQRPPRMDRFGTPRWERDFPTRYRGD